MQEFRYYGFVNFYFAHNRKSLNITSLLAHGSLLDGIETRDLWC